MTVTRAEDDGQTWTLTDLLGRPVGRIQGAGQRFVVQSDERVRPMMAGVRWGPYASLDEALTEIENRSPFICRRAPAPEED